jgi:hypothetical protein
MEVTKISRCNDCPFLMKPSMDGCECTHTGAPKGAYASMTAPYQAPPVWCPIRKAGEYIKIIRDSYDNIVNKKKYIVIKKR